MYIFFSFSINPLFHKLLKTICNCFKYKKATSSRFLIFYIEGNNIRFTVKGYGHGIGMSQTGADSLAKEGKNYEEIINHFYIGVQIKDM